VHEVLGVIVQCLCYILSLVIYNQRCFTYCLCPQLYCPLCKGLVLPYTTLACSTPGPSCYPTCMRILSGWLGRYQLVPTAPSPQTIMQDSPRRISSMSPCFANSSRPYTQRFSCALAWWRMGACWWTSTLSLSLSSTPYAYS